ncbi:MAG: flagellar brake domain-containing protein [bacterium]
MNDIFDQIKELTKLDVDYSDEENHYYGLKSYIKRVEEERLLVDPPCHKGKVYTFHDGQMINITISTSMGVFSGECKVIGREISTISGLWITYPLSNKHVQRREFVRVPMKKDGELIIYTTPSKKEVITIPFKTKDISGKGFSYISNDPLKNYYDIECKLKLDPFSNSFIKSRCDHVYSKATMINGEAKYINAFAFTELTNKDVETIVRECFKGQLELRKKGIL